MCGIAGWLGHSQAQPSPRALPAMLQAIAHRGPDDHGIWQAKEAPVALGHHRLSIVDLSNAGHQPMLSDNGQYVLSYNGEIYNFQALRKELEHAGHIFRSPTDTEVLLRSYQTWGTDCLKRLHGMFAFALWDAQQHRLLLARDHAGIKPLYYWRDAQNCVFFASELKAFLALKHFSAQLNPATLAQFLELGFIYDRTQTSLQGIQKLPPGHYLHLSPTTTQQQPHAFYSLPSVQPLDSQNPTADLHTRTQTLRHTLTNVVQEHLAADVPVGILLSGGLDSSVIAALAARQQPVQTFSFGFAQASLDERDAAKHVSDWIGSQHHEFYFSPAALCANMQADAKWFDDLCGDWGLFTTLQMYRACREHGIKVILTGEGADEVFGGYPWYLKHRTVHQRWPLRAILSLYRHYSGQRWGKQLTPFLRLLNNLNRQHHGDFFTAMRHFELQHHLPHQYNMKVDKASMAASVEARVPYLDSRIMQIGLQAPASTLVQNGLTKQLLRNAATRDNLLPPATINRQKIGGAIPFDWLDNNPTIRSFARDIILAPNSITHDLNLTAPMHAYFDAGKHGQHFPGARGIYASLAWRLLLLNLWAAHYL